MLSEFNKIVLFIASIILIISLIVIGYSLKLAMSQDKFPAIISDCPDYWDISLNNNCINNLNINGNASLDCSMISLEDFTSNGLTDYSVICEKKKWAKGCNITWSGVTNNIKACEIAGTEL
jgi:hypothetical protein